jgi:pyoverdine/dityrosine biosynthesis protein Dit1
VPLPAHDVSYRILDVLQKYGRHIEPEGENNHKWLGRDMFFPRVLEYVKKHQPVKMILPSFPWKSVNRVDKVTGALPDLGEELALSRLNALCVEIGKVYEYGAEVHIATDGLVFNGMQLSINYGYSPLPRILSTLKDKTIYIYIYTDSTCWNQMWLESQITTLGITASHF